MDKVVGSAREAVADIVSGSSLAVGGFGVCGIPSVLIDAVLASAATDLEAVSNNCGVDDWGLGRLLYARRIRRMVSSPSTPGGRPIRRRGRSASVTCTAGGAPDDELAIGSQGRAHR